MVAGSRLTASKSRRAGLTLLEVIIAVAILAIGILAAAGLQTTALRTTRNVSLIQALTERANEELAFQRSVFDRDLEPTAGACSSPVSDSDPYRDEIVCTVEVFDCVVTAGSSAACDDSGAGNAFLVRVTTTSPLGPREVVLQRVLGERPYFDGAEE
ncbi:MAG: prepilin-type N-terminal cleavage/methylation domain-containing protein [Trueperaceae bacterium]|nr:prepilin-type N-terminal cleavage/methylation domain-containing protein [Trueperaceae bacterium]